MKVERIWEAPRVTKPYTEEQWAQIEALGHAVDAELDGAGRALDDGRRADLRGLDDPDGAEWNTAALGADKRLRRRRLCFAG